MEGMTIPPEVHSDERARRMQQWLTGAASAVVIVGGLHVAAAMVTKVLIIVFLAIILSPIYYFLRRRGVPGALSVLLLILFTVGACAYGVGYLVPKSVIEFASRVGEYHREVMDFAEGLAPWLQERGVNVQAEALRKAVCVDKALLAQAGTKAAVWAAQFVSDLTFVLIIVSFLFAELPRLPRARRLPFMTEGRWDLIVRFVHDVRHYMGIKTLISAATGLFVYLGLALLGVDSPVLLGLIAFLLNFVPAIGSVIAAVPAVLLGLSAGGVPTAAAVALLYLVVNQALGNVLEPRVMGTGFGVSPVVVLLSVLFWGWVLGAVGMLFAVPLTMAVRGALLAAPDARSPAPAGSAGGGNGAAPLPGGGGGASPEREKPAP